MSRGVPVMFIFVSEKVRVLEAITAILMLFSMEGENPPEQSVPSPTSNIYRVNNLYLC